MAFEIPADVTKETGSVLSMETKAKILGLNAARSTDRCRGPEEQDQGRWRLCFTCPKPSTLRGGWT